MFDIDKFRYGFTAELYVRKLYKLLNVSTLTISNREKKNKYPKPKRDLNNYRVYSLNDVFNLQLLTYNHIDPKPIISILYDKGYKDPKIVSEMIDQVLSRRNSNA
jgi:DNA-binding transcriptional MerR regulator